MPLIPRIIYHTCPRGRQLKLSLITTVARLKCQSAREEQLLTAYWSIMLFGSHENVTIHVEYLVSKILKSEDAVGFRI